MSWLDLQLMFTQFPPGSSELNQWLDTVAKAAIDVFQLTSGGATSGLDGKEEKRSGLRPSKPGSIWLVAPLVSKLPSAVQGRVLKVAGKPQSSLNVPEPYGSSQPVTRIALPFFVFTFF
jgi:mediator of RNA polymerase II transcription subunit 12